MIKHILLPTDGSEFSDKAAAYAGELARAFEARVTIFTALDPQAVVAAVWGSVPPAIVAPAPSSAHSEYETSVLADTIPRTQAALGELAEEPGVEHAWGHAANEICKFAEAHDVDQIVMGSHGRTGLRALLLGSVSHGVVNRAHCTVTIVR